MKLAQDKIMDVCSPQIPNIQGKTNIVAFAMERFRDSQASLSSNKLRDEKHQWLVNWMARNASHTPNPQSFMHKFVSQHTPRWTFNDIRQRDKLREETSKFENFNIFLGIKLKILQPVFVWKISGTGVTPTLQNSVGTPRISWHHNCRQVKCAKWNVLRNCQRPLPNTVVRFLVPVSYTSLLKYRSAPFLRLIWKQFSLPMVSSTCYVEVLFCTQRSSKGQSDSCNGPANHTKSG